MEDEKILASFNAYDQAEIELYSHAIGYSCALTEIMELLRSKDKYGSDYKTVEEAIEKIREECYDIKNRYHLPE